MQIWALRLKIETADLIVKGYRDNRVSFITQCRQKIVMYLFAFLISTCDWKRYSTMSPLETAFSGESMQNHTIEFGPDYYDIHRTEHEPIVFLFKITLNWYRSFQLMASLWQFTSTWWVKDKRDCDAPISWSIYQCANAYTEDTRSYCAQMFEIYNGGGFKLELRG